MTRHDLGSELLADYYLENHGDPLSEDEQLLLINEILFDLREMGVITFQSDIDADNIDVVFGYDGNDPIMVMREKDSQDAAVVFHAGEWRERLTTYVSMTSADTLRIAQALGDAAQSFDKQRIAWTDVHGPVPRLRPGS